MIKFINRKINLLNQKNHFRNTSDRHQNPLNRIHAAGAHYHNRCNRPLVTPESMIAQYKEDQRLWQRVRNEFYNMAEGGDEYGIRPQYYPDWTNQDFIDVITAVEGSYEEY